MRWFTVFMVALTLAQRPTFKSSVDTVEVYATVKHENGQLVPNLPREAFQILSDGRLVETTVFSNERKTITVALMLDMSASMQSRLLWIREAALAFVDALEGRDRAQIGSFGIEVALSPHLTGDKRLLHRIIRDELWPGGSTPLWYAVDAAMRGLAKESGRRVVLVASDGVTTPGRLGQLGPAALHRRALDEGFMVYGVGVANKGLGQDLKGLADDTGGGFVTLEGGVDLKTAMARVAEELRHQYLLGFSPPQLDGKVHRVSIEMRQGGAKARTARSYRAPAAPR